MCMTALENRVTNLILQVEKMRPKSIAGLIFSVAPYGMGGCLELLKIQH